MDFRCALLSICFFLVVVDLAVFGNPWLCAWFFDDYSHAHAALHTDCAHTHSLEAEPANACICRGRGGEGIGQGGVDRLYVIRRIEHVTLLFRNLNSAGTIV